MRCHCCSGTYTEIMQDVYECQVCSHIHRKFLGDSIEYHQQQYRKDERRTSDEISQTGEIKEKFHENRKGIVSKRMSFLQKYLKEEMECLDIGAGAGTFAKNLSNTCRSVECTELDPNLIKECQRLGFKTYSEDFLKISFEKKYDFVSAWHVLEHVEDIKSFVEKLKEVSRDLVCIEIPLLKAIDGKGRERKLYPPNKGRYDGHTHYFCKESFEALTAESFEILELKEGVQTPALFCMMRVKNDN